MKTSARSTTPAGTPSSAPHAGIDAGTALLLPPRVRAAAASYRNAGVSSLEPFRQRRHF